MADERSFTGTRDVTYNLVAVLYHALQGAENAEYYAQDADRAGNQELAQFFRQVLEEERRRADRAKMLLGKTMGQGGSR